MLISILYEVKVNEQVEYFPDLLNCNLLCGKLNQNGIIIVHFLTVFYH